MGASEPRKWGTLVQLRLNNTDKVTPAGAGLLTAIKGLCTLIITTWVAAGRPNMDIDIQVTLKEDN